jgi:hypothetical protein
MAINPNRTVLDSNQIFQRSFDETEDRIRVDAEVTATIGTVEVIITDTDDSIKIGNGSGDFAEVTNGNLNVVTSNTLITSPFDYISASYPTATSEVYTYKLGGSGGTTVGTITVNYTDSSKVSITNVAKT